MTDQLKQVQELRAVLPQLDTSSRSFAENLLAGFERYGSLTDKQLPWLGKLIARASQPAKTTATIGDLGGILALFDVARKHLKFPAVALGVPGFVDYPIRISVAGDKAKFPGSLTVTSADKFDRGGEFAQRDWYGRITLDGAFQAGNRIDEIVGFHDAVVARLRAFAADPSKVGGEDGRLHGRCCFCRLPLSDERSTAVGYGKKCASNFGLAWGSRPAEFAASA